MEKTIFRATDKMPVDLTKHSFNIVFNPEQKIKDAKKVNMDDEKLLQSYIEAIKPKIQTIINISNIEYAKDIETGEISEKDVFEVVNEVVLLNIRDPNKKFCTNLYEKYVENSLENCNAIITFEDGDNVISFATIYFNVPNELYIDVICSSQLYLGGGNETIKKIKEICKKILIGEIKLSSVTESIGFYVKQNFECDELCDMKLTVGGRKTRKWSAKYKKSINCKRPKGFSQKQHCKYGKKTKKSKSFQKK